MTKIWFCSDHHFGHENIIKYAGRPFKDVEEMNKAMIQKHNFLVDEEDKVYFLGDVAFSQNVFHRIMPHLKGKKRLILGNHDRFKLKEYFKHFHKIYGSFNFKSDGFSFHCTHYPAKEISFNPNGDFINVHGHIHEKVIDDPRYINICVEQTAYAPVDVEWLVGRAKLARK